MGLGRGWLKMPFCDDQGLQGPGLHQAVGAASKGVGEDTPVCKVAKISVWHPMEVVIHVLVLAASAKGVMRVNV